MRPGRLNSLMSKPSVVVALLLLVFTSQAVTAAASHSDLRASRRAPSPSPRHDGPRSSSAFPLLTWLRDSAIELVFGKHPSSTGAGGGGGGGSSGASHYSSIYQPARYSKQTVIRFSVTTAEEEKALAEATSRLFLDVWAFNNHTGTVDIRLNKEDVSSLLTLLPESLHHAFSPLIPDLAVAVQDTYPKAAAAKSAAVEQLSAFTSGGSTSATGMAAVLSAGLDNVFFQDYQPLPVIEQWMRLMDVMFPFVEMISVGQSAEGRDIFGLRVGAAKTDGDGDEDEDVEDPDKTRPTPEPEPEPSTKRKTILMTGGLHAREWITTSTVNYLAWSLIAGYGKARLITKLLDHFDIVFVPVVNPDGYEYTWHTDRLWRKTRQGTNFRYCRGLDLDHAFGYAWDSNVHVEPCSESYGGEAAFQAAEARTLAMWARSEVLLRDVEFVGFLDLHSYSQQILFPFSYSCTADPPNLENLEELAAGLAKAIRLSTGELYSISSACEGVLSMSRASPELGRIESGGGSAIDWFYHELHARYSYQIKLRDTGSYGFLLPSSEIVPTGEEIFSAFKYFGDFLLGNNGIERSYESNVDSSSSSSSSRSSSKATELADGDHWTELRRRTQK